MVLHVNKVMFDVLQEWQGKPLLWVYGLRCTCLRSLAISRLNI